ncbi:MAG: Skp family chaperone for outer membrane protein [Glaciecola sp.]|jgi:Skp family chaperone for outer membrane proteins
MKTFFSIILSVLLVSCSTGEKTGYIDINEVYREINITKKYNKHLAALENDLAYKISQERTIRQTTKDEVLAKKSPSQKDLEVVFKMTTEMDSIEKHYSKAFKDSSDRYNLLVEKTVNDLVYRYGQEQKFTYLYSPATSNSFMYADSSLDVTLKVIKFIDSETK